MDTSRLLEVLEAITSTPTAPFHEYRLRDTIRELLNGLEGVRLEEDAFGNLIARYGEGEPGWCFGAHMDHPGWVRRPGDFGKFKVEPFRERGEFYFLGGVPERYFEKQPPMVEFGDFGMWDLPAFEVRDTQVHSRACDDLVGCASIVALLTDLSESGADVSVAGAFTRAEEVGFVGAAAFGETWPFAPETCFVSLETSIATNGAVMGSGAMVRVGDRISVFDHHATANMLAAAKKREVPAQRALLDKGACEATALQAFGVRTAGISVPLGNYHNCAEDDTIQPEFVEIADFESLCGIVGAMVEDYPDGPTVERTDLQERLAKRVSQHAVFVAETTKRFGGNIA
jgi:endoglucanase